TGKSALYGIADECLHQPVMSIEADGAAGVKVVQQHVSLGESMVVGSDVPAVHHQLCASISFRDIAEHLVVGAVFFDDQEYVPDAMRRGIGYSTRRLKFRAVGWFY